MAWEEMSYKTYIQDYGHPEPEVWDNEYEPTEQEWMEWVTET